MEFKEEGLLILATMLGEMLDNCEIRGGSRATWYTQGYYENNPNKSYGEFQLLFLNLGNVVYEGLRDASGKETKARLESFLDKHGRFGGKTE